MKKILILALVAVLCCMMVVGCAADEETKNTEETTSTKVETVESEGTASTSDKIVVGFSFSSQEGSAYKSIEDYLVKVCEQYTAETGTEIELHTTVANSDAVKQTADVQDLLTLNPDVMILMAQDSSAIVASIQACHDQDIPVIMYARAETTDAVEHAEVFCGLDSVAQAYDSGCELFKRMKAAGIEDIYAINVSGSLSDENTINRNNGFEQACDEYGVTLVQTIVTEWDAATGQSGLSASLKAHPEINAVFVASDFILSGVQAALEEAGRWAPSGDANHMWLAGQDVYPVGLEALEGGYMDSDVAYDTWACSEVCLDLILALVDGEEIEYDQSIKGRLVTPDNVATIDNLWARDYKDE